MNWKKVAPLITIVIVLVVLFYVYKYVVKTREGFFNNQLITVENNQITLNRKSSYDYVDDYNQ